MTDIRTAEDLASQLVAVAHDHDAARSLAREDPHRVASAVLDEVAARATLLGGPPAPVVVQFELRVDDQRLGFLLTTGPDGTTVAPGWTDGPWVRITQDLVDLLRGVYTPGDHHHPSRAVVVREEPGPRGPAADDPWLARWNGARVAAGVVVRACAPVPADLSTLALRFGSDKWGGHWYTPHYERHLAAFRDRAVRILEIGIGGYESPRLGGASLRMWKHYFPRGLVYGLDIADKSPLDEPRLRTIRGDQSDPEFLAALADRVGPLDIVVDDGSHVSAHVITSFTTLFPKLPVGGLYVIEDLQTSYWPSWNGNHHDLNDPNTTMGFLKTLMDDLHRPERVEPAGTPIGVPGVTAVHLYRNIAFVEKGIDQEQPGPAWMRGG